MFDDARGQGSSICINHKASQAPAIPVDSTRHSSITYRQGRWAKQHRDAGTQPSYDEARREGRNQTRMAGANRKEAECIMKFVDQVMEQLCPDLVQSKGNNLGKLRTPGSKGNGSMGGGF